MLLTCLFIHVMSENPDLSNGPYVLYDRVMHPLTAQQDRKTRKDYGTRRGRSSASSLSAFGQPSSSHPNDDDNDGNDKGTSLASTPSPTRFVNSLLNDIPQIFSNPPDIDPNMEAFYTRQAEILNHQVQLRDEQRGGIRSIGKGIKNLLRGKKKKPSNLIPLQSHPSLDITISLSPITPLDHILDTPSPPSPQPPPQPHLMDHPIYFNTFDYYRASKGSKSSCGDFGIAKSWITCVNTNRNTTLSEAQGVSLRHLWGESKCRNEMERGLAQMSVIVGVSHDLRDDSRNLLSKALPRRVRVFAWRIPILVIILKMILRHSKLFEDLIVQLGRRSLRARRGGLRAEEEEIDFRNFVYAEDAEDLSFLPNEPTPGFGTGSPSVSVNIEPLRADEEPALQPTLQPAEVITDSVGSLKLELFVIYPGSVATRIKDKKCKTRGGSSRPPVKRKLAFGSSNSHATRAKTSTLKDDVLFLTVSNDDEGLSNDPELKDATACHLKIFSITPPARKNHLDNHIDVELLDLHDRCYAWQAVVDNAVNRRFRKLLEVIEKLRGECDNLTVIALRQKISTLSIEVKEHKANLNRMMLESQKWESYQASLLTLESQISSLEAEKAWLEAVEVSLRKEVVDVKRDKMEVVSKVVPYAAMEHIHSDDLVAGRKEPFDLSKVKGYHPSYKKEHNQFGNDLATTTFPWLSEFVADPSAPVEVLLSKKPSSLQRPAPSKTQDLVASSLKATPSSILGSNLMSPPTNASVVKPLSSQVE
ncbi:hypothetical protein Tco_0844454 [Tanacetum coccineum]